MQNHGLNTPTFHATEAIVKKLLHFKTADKPIGISVNIRILGDDYQIQFGDDS